MPDHGCVDLTVIDSEGSPRAMGQAHGESARELVEQSWAGWQEAMAHQGHEPAELVAALNRQTDFRDSVTEHVPDLMAEVAGIADGSGVPEEAVFALNCLDEAWWWSEQASGCSTIAIGAEGVAFAGQTMDLDDWMDETQIALRTRPTDGPAAVMLSRAGMVGLCGVNEGGLAVLVNTLSQLPVSRLGVPVAFVMRAALAQTTVNDAAACLQRLPHASGQAYTLASADGVIGLECGAGVVVEYVNDVELVQDRWHTNHPLTAVGDDDVKESSRQRLAVLDRRAPELSDPADLKKLLSDGDAGVCVYPGRWPGTWTTFGAIAVELGSEPHVEIAPGPPDRTDWTPVSFLR